VAAQVVSGTTDIDDEDADEDGFVLHLHFADFWKTISSRNNTCSAGSGRMLLLLLLLLLTLSLLSLLYPYSLAAMFEMEMDAARSRLAHYLIRLGSMRLPNLILN
jgi:hypothetical protein